MPPITPRKLRVVADVRAWAPDRTNKMGWLRVDDVVEIDEEYQGWVGFMPVSECPDLKPLESWDKYWIEPNMGDRFEAYSEEPTPEPEPEPGPGTISDEELGAAVRIVMKAFWETSP